jgi:hypothetical protein
MHDRIAREKLALDPFLREKVGENERPAGASAQAHPDQP